MHQKLWLASNWWWRMMSSYLLVTFNQPSPLLVIQPSAPKRKRQCLKSHEADVQVQTINLRATLQHVCHVTVALLLVRDEFFIDCRYPNIHVDMTPKHCSQHLKGSHFYFYVLKKWLLKFCLLLQWFVWILNIQYKELHRWQFVSKARVITGVEYVEGIQQKEEEATLKDEEKKRKKDSSKRKQRRGNELRRGKLQEAKLGGLAITKHLQTANGEDTRPTNGDIPGWTSMLGAYSGLLCHQKTTEKRLFKALNYHLLIWM